MRIAKNKAKTKTPLINPTIDLVRPLVQILKKGEYIEIKCHTTQVPMTADPLRSTSHTMEEKHLGEGLSRITHYPKL